MGDRGVTCRGSRCLWRWGPRCPEVRVNLWVLGPLDLFHTYWLHHGGFGVWGGDEVWYTRVPCPAFQRGN